MSTDLYVIGSPLQALNAIEARGVFTSENAVVVVVETVQAVNNAQIRSILESEKWNATHTVGIRAGRFRKRYTSVADVVGQMSHVRIGRLFLGFFDDIFLHFAHSLPHDELLLLDDGVATLTLNYARVHNCSRVMPFPPWKQFARQVLMRLADGIKTGPLDAIRYFTVYDHLDRDSRNHIQTHSMERLRRRRAMTSQSDEVWLLGLGSEQIFKTQEMYLDAVERIVTSWAPAPVRYLPHRFESPRQLELIERRTGATILQTGMPVELYLAGLQTVPAAVCSLISSALYTVGVLFPNSIRMVSYRMNFELVRRRYHEQFGLIYRYYERTSFIEVLDVGAPAAWQGRIHAA